MGRNTPEEEIVSFACPYCPSREQRVLSMLPRERWAALYAWWAKHVADCTVRAAAEPEAKACVFCKHLEPHTKREGKCDHLKLGCTAPGCECDAYEVYP